MRGKRRSHLSASGDRKRKRNKAKTHGSTSIETPATMPVVDTSQDSTSSFTELLQPANINVPGTSQQPDDNEIDTDINLPGTSLSLDDDQTEITAQDVANIVYFEDGPLTLEALSRARGKDFRDYAKVGNIYNGIQCDKCGAFRLREERPGFCCGDGNIRPPPMPEHPLELLSLYDDANFLKNIRYYNNAFAMASLGCNEVYSDGYSPTVQIHGKIYHMVGSLTPDASKKPVYSQIYFYDIRHELENRCSLSDKLKPATIQTIQNCLHRCNPYIQELKKAEKIAAVAGDVNIVFSHSGPDKTYSLPVNDQIAAIASNFTSTADIVLSTLEGNLKRISEMHKMYDPLHYVLFFPYGTDGYKAGMEKSNKRNMTPEEFYLYHLQIRDETIKNNIFLRSRRLTQQFVCDQFVKIEKFRMNWIRHNQGTIRAEKYQGFLDAIDMSDNIIREAIGRRVILPPTFYGSPRWYSGCFQDCMSIVRTFGSADLFLTFTYNPEWDEITQSLGEGETADDRPDLSVRVFHAKLKKFLSLITTEKIFGKVAAHTCMVEYQKRGLPHAHILLIMASTDKIRDPAQVDKIISAEIPDATVNPKLHRVITTFNLHGPCGNLKPSAPCNANSKDKDSCARHFPRSFNNEGTNINPKMHYPLYLRRDELNGGRTFSKFVDGKEVVMDNRWVVPYSPVLSEIFEAHINVEVVMSLGAVKYLYKYVTKGSDKIMYSLQGTDTVDEVEMYEVGRFVSATEAFWQIYQFKINMKHPNVKKMPIHLPKQQLVYFDPDNIAEAAEKEEPKTELMAFFELNERDEAARSILYPDIPKYYTWQSQKRSWERRKLNLSATENDWLSDTIGRIPIINLNPKQEELYYLRICLHHIPGPRSFEDLRTVNGNVYGSYKEACVALGLLEDDRELSRTIETAATVTFGHDLRKLFGTLLTHCNPTDAAALWDEHKELFVQDYIRQAGQGQIRDITHLDYNRALREIQRYLYSFGLDLPYFAA